MRICKPKTNNVPVFSGRVKVIIVGIDQHGYVMSLNRGGVKSKCISIYETTLDAVYKVIYKALDEEK